MQVIEPNKLVLAIVSLKSKKRIDDMKSEGMESFFDFGFSFWFFALIFFDFFQYLLYNKREYD